MTPTESEERSETGPKIVGIVQARMGSSRLPEKMKRPLGGVPVAEWVLRRSRTSKRLSQVALATTRNASDIYLENLAKRLGLEAFRGDEQNVLSRFVMVADQTDADIVVRICADNPFIDAGEVDRIVEYYLDVSPDYAFNHIPKLQNNYVDGLGAEVFSTELLKKISNEAFKPDHFEHVTSYLWDFPDKFDIRTISAPAEFAHPELSLDIDTIEDFECLSSHLREVRGDGVPPESFDVRELIRSMLASR